jgi:heme oxygenase
MSKTLSNIRKEIKARTRHLHEGLEELPVSKAIVDETISRDAYAAGLQQHYHVYAALERALETTPTLEGVYRQDQSRLEHVRADLTFFGAEPNAELLEASNAIIALFNRFAAEDPLALLGAFYVFEGSRLGSSVLYLHLSRALDVDPAPGNGLDMHMGGLATLGRDFKRLLEILERFAEDDEQTEAIVAGAESTFRALRDLYAALPAD